MARTDRPVDAYIENAAVFAKPILKHLRKLVHQACPNVEEAIKWQFPCFMYQGMLCSMAAFKNHCTFGFWKHKLLFARDKAPGGSRDQGMGQFGRLTSLSDLPPDKVLLGYLKEAMHLNEQGIKLPSPPKRAVKRVLVVPDDLSAALQKNKKASDAFGNFSYSHKKEYLEWITEAKRQDTRQRRLDMTIQWVAQGKPRNWKYMNCGS